MTNRKYILHSICLILFSILLLSSIAYAEIEINTTLEDNLVILLDYSGSTAQFREYIQSNALYSIRNIDNSSNVSVLFYGGFIKSSNLYPMDFLENRTILEEFIRNIKGKEGDAARDNIYEGFNEARKILDKSTGTKQIVLISDGNLDGRFNGKLNDDALIELVKQLKKNNVTINLSQVSTTKLSSALKKTSVREPYKDLSDKLNTEVVVLNPDERIRFLKIKSHKTIVSVSSEVANSSQIDSPNSVDIPSEGDEYLNEFNNSGESSSVISVMYYGQKASSVNFYSYCNQTCIIVPFDIGDRKFYDDKQILEDIFRNKNAIELVKSGNITEAAYTFSSSNFICDYYDIDVFKEESINLGGKVAPLVKPESAKVIKPLKGVGMISKFNEFTFVASVYCLPSNNDDILNKIAGGKIYTDYLKIGYAYNGIVGDFRNHDGEIIENINDREKSLWNLIYIFNNPMYDNQLPLIKNNYAHLVQLSTQNYDNEVESAIRRFNDKSEESRTFINNATNELNEINSQIPNTFVEKIVNFFEEPETNYTTASLKRDNAESFLKTATEDRGMYKFNSAIQNSNDSIAQSREGIKFVNLEKSKDRYFKNWVEILEQLY
jgi:hypothetical protein